MATQPTKRCRSRAFRRGETLIIADHSPVLQILALLCALLFSAGVAGYALTLNEDPNFLYYVLLPFTVLVWIGCGTVAWTGGERLIFDRLKSRVQRGIHLGFGIMIDASTQPIGVVTSVAMVTDSRAVLIKKSNNNLMAPAVQKTCLVELTHLPAGSRQPAEFELCFTNDVAGALQLGHRIARLLKVTPRESRVR